MRKRLERELYLKSQYAAACGNKDYLRMLYYKILILLHNNYGK